MYLIWVPNSHKICRDHFSSPCCALSGAILPVARTEAATNAAPSATCHKMMPDNANCCSKRKLYKDGVAVAPCGLIAMQIRVHNTHTHPQTDTCPEHVKWCANLINNWCQQQELLVKCLLVLGGVKSFGCGLSSAVLGLRFALSSCFLPCPIYHTHPVAIEHCTLHFFRLLVLLWRVIDLSFQCP